MEDQVNERTEKGVITAETTQCQGPLENTLKSQKNLKEMNKFVDQYKLSILNQRDF